MSILSIVEGLSPAQWRQLALASIAQAAHWLKAQGARAALAPRLIALARQRDALMQLIEPAPRPHELLSQLRDAGRNPAAMLGALDEPEALALLGALCGVSAHSERAGRFDGWPVWRLDDTGGLCIELPARWALALSPGATLSLRADGPRIARYAPDGLRHRWRLIDALQPLPIGRLEDAAPLHDATTGALITSLPLIGQPVALFVGARRVWRVEPGQETLCVFDHGARVSRMSGGFAREVLWSERHAREIWRGVFPAEPLIAWDEADAPLCALSPGQPVWPQRAVAAPPQPRWPFELALVPPRHQLRDLPLSPDEPVTMAALQGADAIELRAAPWALVSVRIGPWSAERMLDSWGRARLWLPEEEAMLLATQRADQLVVCCGEEQLVFALSHQGAPPGRPPGLRLIPTEETNRWRIEGLQRAQAKVWLHFTPCASPWITHRFEVDTAHMSVTLPPLATRGRYDLSVEGAIAGPGWAQLDGAGDVGGALGRWFADSAQASPDALREALMALDPDERRRVVSGLVSWYRHHHMQHHTMSDAVLRALAPWRLLTLLRAHSDEERALWAISGVKAASWYAVKPQDLWCALELAGPLDAALWRGWLDALDARGGGLRAMAHEVWRAPLSALATTGWAMPELPRGPSLEHARPLAELDEGSLRWERLTRAPVSAPLSAAEAALIVDPREQIVADWAYALHLDRLGLGSAPLPRDAHRVARQAPALMDHWLTIWTRRERLALQGVLAAQTTWPHARRSPIRG